MVAVQVFGIICLSLLWFFMCPRTVGSIVFTVLSVKLGMISFLGDGELLIVPLVIVVLGSIFYDLASFVSSWDNRGNIKDFFNGN